VHLDIFERMYSSGMRPDALVYAELFTLDPDGTLHLHYGAADLTFRQVEDFSFNGYSIHYNTIVSGLFKGPDQEFTLIRDNSGAPYDAGPGDDRLIGTAYNDRLYLGDGNDQVLGGLGADLLIGGGGDDYLHGSDALTNPQADLSDSIYAGAGNDTLIGGYGNDVLYGMDGDDQLFGGFGSDFLAGQAGNDVLTGAALSDQLFGNAGDDFLNGGFGHDRVNGGSGADRFYHLGIADHGSDWIQDYTAAEGDVLLFGDASATADDLAEGFVIYRPTGQILWALVDGAGQDQINLRIGGEIFDLLA